MLRFSRTKGESKDAETGAELTKGVGGKLLFGLTLHTSCVHPDHENLHTPADNTEEILIQEYLVVETSFFLKPLKMSDLS